MANLGFPSNPYIGQTYTIGNRTWVWNGNGWQLQSGVTSFDPFTANRVIVTTTTNATSTNTGGLIVYGGVGIGEDLWVGGGIYASNTSYVAGAQVITTNTIGDLIGSKPIKGPIQIIYTGTNTALTVTGNSQFNGSMVVTGNLQVEGTVTNIDSKSVDIGYKVIYLSTLSTTASQAINAGLIIGEDAAYSTSNQYISLLFDGINSWKSSGNLLPSANLAWNLGNTSTYWGTVYANSLVANTATLGAVFDNGLRVISQINVGLGIGESQPNGPTVLLTNTGVLQVLGGVDTYVNTSTQIVTVNNSSTLQTVTSRGSSTNQIITITNATSSTSNTSGALIVAGGLGVSSNIYANAIYDNDSRVVTQATIGTYGVTTLTAGTDTAVSTSTGPVVVWNVSTLQSVTSRGSSTNQAITITNGTQSTSQSTGALVITGGIGAGGNIYGNYIYGNSVYDSNLRVVTQVIPYQGPGIGISSLTSSGPQVSFYVTNLGVQSLTPGTGLSVTTSTGTVIIVSTDTFQSVTGRGAITPYNIAITSNTDSTSTNSGALVVTGGVGIGGTTYAGPIYSNGSPVLTQASIANYGVTSLAAGTDTAISTATGAVTIWSTATLQSITGRGATTTNAITFANTSSSSVSILGGLTVAGNETVNGILYVQNSQSPISTTTGALQVVGGVGIGGAAYIGGNVKILSATSATSTLTGALQVAGGAGIQGDLYIGGAFVYAGNLYDNNFRVITTATIAQYAVTAAVAGTDTAVSTSTGVVTFWNTSTLQTITSRGSSTNQIISITNTTTNTATSFTSGNALIVAGSIGANSINLSTSSFINGAQILTTMTGIIAQFDGGTIHNPLVIATGTQSTSTFSGALVVNGGVGIGGNLYVGGQTVFQGNVTFNGTATYVFASQNYYTENLIVLHATTSTTGANNWTFDDGKDVGIIGDYYDTVNSTATQFFMGWRHGTASFEFMDTGYQNTSGNFVGLYGDLTAANFFSKSTSQAYNTSTGAIQTLGGIGAAGSIYGAGIYDGATRVISTVTAGVGLSGGGSGPVVVLTNTGVLSVTGTTYLAVSTSTGYVTLTNLGVQTLSTGSTDISVSTSTGSVVVTNLATLQSVTDRGNSTTNQVVITNYTKSTSYSSGALVVNGGVGIGDTLNVFGIFTASNLVTFSSTVQANSTNSGALVVAGGVGVGGDLYAGNMYSNGSQVLTYGTLASAGVSAIVAGTDTAVSTATGAVTIWNTSTLASITVRGAITTSTIVITGTGSLLVANTISGAQVYDSGARVVTTASISNYAVTSLTSGNGDIIVNTSTGAVTITEASTLQSVTNRGNQTTQTVILLNTGTSIQAYGSAQFTGTVAAGVVTTPVLTATNAVIATATITTATIGTLNVSVGETDNGFLTVGGLVNFLSTLSNAVTIAGGVSVTGNLTAGSINTPVITATNAVITSATIAFANITTASISNETVTTSAINTLTVNISETNKGSLTVNGLVAFTTTTASTSTLTGGLVVTGGVGIGGTLNAGIIFTPVLTATNISVTNLNVSSTETDSGALTVGGIVNFTNTSASTSTTTGALIVAGGVGIQGSLYAGPMFSNGSPVLTGSSLGGYGVTSLAAGTDTAVTTATGNVVVFNTSTLQSITSRGSSTNQAITISNATASTSTYSGALVVTGGIGAGGLVYSTGFTSLTQVGTSTVKVISSSSQIAQIISDPAVGPSVTFGTTAAGSLYGSLNAVTGYVTLVAGTGRDLKLYGAGSTNSVWISASTGNVGIAKAPTAFTLDVGGSANISSTASSTSTTTGALVVAGGAGFGGALYIGTDSYVAGSLVITTATVNTYASKTIITAGTDTAVSTSTGNVTIWDISTLQSVTGRGNSTTNIVVLNSTTYSTNTVAGNALQVPTGGIGTNYLYINTAGYINGQAIVTTATANAAVSQFNGGTITNPLYINTTTVSTGTASGALIVGGGVGIAGALYVGGTTYLQGDLYVDGTQTVINSVLEATQDKTLTLGNSLLQASTNGAGIQIGSTTTPFISWLFDAGNNWVSSNGIKVTNTATIGSGTAATSSSTGALIVSGGAGISGIIYAGGFLGNAVTATNVVATNINATNATISTGSFTTATVGTLNVTGSETDAGGLTVNGLVAFNTTTNSTSTSSGGLVVKGEVGIGGNLYVGGTENNNALYVATTATIAGATSATSTTTGALIVAGGVGIGGMVYAGGNMYSNGALVLTTASLGSGGGVGVTTITAGTDTAVSGSTGAITIWNTSTLASITSRGSATTSTITIQNATASTSTTTGALIVQGGIGVGSNIVVGYGAVRRGLATEARASGSFVNAGDAQSSVYVLRTANLTNTANPLTSDGGAAGAGNQVVMPDNSVFTFRVLVTAKSTTSADNAGFEFNGVVTRTVGAATVVLQRVNKDKIWSTSATIDANVTVDTTNGALQITGTGDGANNVRFVAKVETTEVTN